MPQVIVIALGIEARDWDGPALQRFLKAHCDPQPGDVWTFPKGATKGKVTHEVRVIYDMAAFGKALDLDNAFVVYDGHSRYGQGPAFGPSGTPHVPDKKKFPTNPWGVHYRMGYDATDTECIDDLMEHSVTPTEYDLVASGAKAFLPSALVRAASNARKLQKAVNRKKIKAKAICGSRGAWRLFNTCDAALAATTTARGDKPLDGRHYYAFLKRKPANEYLTSVKVGSADLGKSSLKCSLLFMGSCSSRVHFYGALAKRRKAVKSKSKFLLTGLVCSADHGKGFLEQVLVKGRDPMTRKGMKALLKALNGVSGSGIVGIY